MQLFLCLGIEIFELVKWNEVFCPLPISTPPRSVHHNLLPAETSSRPWDVYPPVFNTSLTPPQFMASHPLYEKSHDPIHKTPYDNVYVKVYIDVRPFSETWITICHSE